MPEAPSGELGHLEESTANEIVVQLEQGWTRFFDSGGQCVQTAGHPSMCYTINSTAWFVAFTVSNLTASSHMVSFSRLLRVPMKENRGTMKSFHESRKCVTGGKIISDSPSFQGGNKEKHEAMLYLI